MNAAGDTDLASVGALLAEPARAKVLLALGDGRSLPASMLAAEAGVAPSTASHHLARLLEGGLITAATRGRHRDFTLAGPEVADLIEAVARVAPAQPVTSLRQGTRAHALRYARRCYDHLAGRLGVALADGLRAQGVVEAIEGGFVVTAPGARRLGELGIAVRSGESGRSCVDWTEQRGHIAGTVGRALLTGVLDRGWIVCDARTRALRLTRAGRDGLPAELGVVLP
jgi:DNA-binding transcriptional ArsR family regulator